MNKTHSIPINTQICPWIDLVRFCRHPVSRHNAVLESAMGRALDLWSQSPALFQQLALQGMADDNSWAISAQQYVEIYEVIRHK